MSSISSSHGRHRHKTKPKSFKKPFKPFPSKDKKVYEKKVEPKVETTMGKKFVDLVPAKKKTWGNK
jgi:hypothetical protein